MSKQDSSYESSQPMPTAPPSYDQSMYPTDIPQMIAQMPTSVQAEYPPYHYQPVPVAHEIPVLAPQQQYVQTQAQLPVFNTNVPVGPQQVRTTCPHCQATVKSKVDTESSMGAHVCCFVLCIFGCCLCSCIPYCMDSFKIVKHTCPNCKAYLGTYKP